jgi:hypothetical protein
MPYDEFDYEDLTKSLTDNFNILADEVQLLSDRKTILEHKLRFAHEQVSTDRISLRVSFYIMMKNISSRSGDCFCSEDRQTPCILNIQLHFCFSLLQKFWIDSD